MHLDGGAAQALQRRAQGDNALGAFAYSWRTGSAERLLITIMHDLGVSSKLLDMGGAARAGGGARSEGSTGAVQALQLVQSSYC